MINIKMQPTEVQKLSPKITVIGVGGAGGNAVNNMISSGLEGCEFLVCNTDAQALDNSLCDNKLQLGASVTGGLGAGSRPEVGQSAAEESLEDVMKHLEGANMAFVTAGMGGGTGTGAAPVIAKACREKGILTVGVITKPFHFEGSHRMEQAEAGIKEMQGYVDTLIVIPNQNLFRIANEKTTFAEGFKMADSVLQSGVRGVTDLMVRPGLVNLDFADIRTAMLEMGKAMMGTGEAEGEKRAIEAAEAAINNPLLDDVTMKGARGVIINVTGGYDMTLFEADEACNRIRDEVDSNANIIFGATFDDNLEGKMRVSIVATGIEKEAFKKSISGGGSGKLHRAQPNHIVQEEKPEETQAEQAPVAQPTAVPQQKAIHALTGADAVRNITAPPSAARSTAAPAAPAEPEVDMFEQQEFAESQSTGEVQNTALRGARYKDSFIPPAPAVPGAFSQGVGPHISNFEGAHVAPAAATGPSSSPAAPVRRRTEDTAGGHVSSPGIQLNPPKMPMGANKKRSPSLFERITGSVQQHIDGLREEVMSGQPAPQAGSPATSAPSGGPSQGTLNVDAPSAPAENKGGSDLDIPAFLRRQAN